MNEWELSLERIKEIKIDTDKRVSRAIDAYEGNLPKVEINKIYETGELSIVRAANKKLVEWLIRHLNKRDVGGINPEWALSDKDLQSLKKELGIK